MLALGRTRAGAMLWLFAAAVFLSAFLLFLVQPLFARLMLPLLGGSPAVWNTCMLFFQAALLAGYLYAHVTTRLLDRRRQAVAHCVLLAGIALLLPIGAGGAAPEGGAAPIPWLLTRMAATVGPPFFVLAGTGPMLQRWFAESGHPGRDNPYRLYAASNLGSMVALLVYPVLVEPRLRLAGQSSAWAGGYLLLGALLVACAAAVWRSPVSAAPGGTTAQEVAAPSVARRARWIFLAFVPSSLLLGATTYITTDLTPAPLLWVAPLALYLLSFTLVFARQPPVPHGWMLWAQPSLLALVVLMLLGQSLERPALAVPLHLAALFVTAMVCHGELSRTRPPAARLTEFYFWLSLGGVLGGAFNVLVAPLLFTRTWEYPLVLVLACLARPWPPSPLRAHLRRLLSAAALVAALLLLTGPHADRLPSFAFFLSAGLVLHLLTVLLRRRPLWLALCLAAVVGVRIMGKPGYGEVLFRSRSFFGHYEVYRTPVAGGFHVLTHGSTVHGAQSLDPERRHEPLTYYLSAGPVGDIFNALGVSTRPHRIAVVGLGTGASAAYADPGERWTFYEIDPGIERVARDRRLFTHLAESQAAETRVVLGDARLSLAEAPRDEFDLILLDAFSSDAVPVHLLTREALAAYRRTLAPGGLIGFHISNRYLDLEPVLARLAADAGMAARISSGPATRGPAYEYTSTWVVLAETQAEMATLDAIGWRRARPRQGLRVWTDDFSSVVSVFRW